MGPRTDRALLIVDDTPANLVAFEGALESLGRPIVTARSGLEALAVLRERAIALVVLDVHMPGMDGFEAAAAIRSNAATRAVPIVFITAHDADHREVLRGYQLGAADFLFKPIQPEVLRAKASVFLELQDLIVAEREKDHFLAILGHELRNPLAAITTALDLVDRAPERPMPTRVRQVLGRQVRQLQRLVDDLLDVSRFSAGKVSLEREPLSITETVDAAVATTRPLYEERRHTLVLSPPATPAIVMGDLVRLTQVVSNLLVNAAKYTPRGGRVEVSWGNERGAIVLRVRDNGKGISPELLGSIFEMFVQERAGSDGSGGLGVGLALVRRLVERHGGTVRAESDGAGKGSTFEVRLPSFEGASAAQTRTGRLPALADTRPLPHTLIVDDQDDLRDLVAELLISHGHRVVTACDGPSALAAIEKERPDAALIDIGLPGMDGYDVARAIRAAGVPTPRLIAMTGYGQDIDRQRVEQAGFDLHIVKPASAETILRALAQKTI